MRKYNLGFISDETIYEHVKATVKSYRREITLKQFNENIIDPIKLTFDSKVYGKNTTVGVYTDEVTIERENCSSVIALSLEVGEPVAIENISLADLTLYPNPVAVGETIYIDGEFTSEELNGMQVEIYSMLGQSVTQFEPYEQPILVEGLSERGLYIVRVIAGNGTIYQGKIIVK